MPKKNNPLKHFAALSGLGIQMGVIIYWFVWGGKQLDFHYNSGQKRVVAIGAVLGVAVALFVVLKQLKQINSK